MSKAYDRMEWNFMEKMMAKLGFSDKWINLVMKCVTTVSYRIKVNDEYTYTVRPQRGLRQGDPVSPFLFIICAEALSAMLQQAEIDGKIQGIRICEGAPRINHLLFADDSLILMRAQREDAKELQRILDVYERASGQMINRDKSSVLFSPNTDMSSRDHVKEELYIASGARNERYLGLPVSIGKSRKKAFQYIKRRIWGRIQGWQEKLLSKAGKEVLIKAVAQAIPTYAMSCFDLTKGLCDELNSLIGKWWWNQNDKENKIHWLSWDKLTLPKKDGGLGFRDLHLFNLAMLARQAWRILTNPDSLCSRVLKAKYFPDSTILHCTARDGISYTWRSILQGVQLLKEGVVWRVGNGTSLNIWSDPWIPLGVTRRPATPRVHSLLTKVADLINPITGMWDELLVKDTFWERDAEIILSMVTDENSEDWPAWHFNPKGVFTVKSAYKLAVSRREHEKARDASGSNDSDLSQRRFDWKKIWRLPLPNKVKMFIWRVAHNSLPVRRNIARRGMKGETICPMCCRLDEDCGNLFFKCQGVKEVWRMLNLESARTILA